MPCFSMSEMTFRIGSDGFTEITGRVAISFAHIGDTVESRFSMVSMIFLNVDSFGSACPLSIFAIYACVTPAKSASSF